MLLSERTHMVVLEQVFVESDSPLDITYTLYIATTTWFCVVGYTVIICFIRIPPPLSY